MQNELLEYDSVQFNLVNPSGSAINVNIFDLNTLTPTPTTNVANSFPNALGVTVPTGASNEGIAYDTSTSRMWVSRPLASVILVFDKALNLLQTIGTGTASITTMEYDATRNRIYAGDSTTGIVTVFDAATFASITTIATGATTLGRIVVAENVGKYYVTDTGADAVIVINSFTNAIVATVALVAGDLPKQCTYNPNNNKVYVSAFGNSFVRVISSTTDSLTTSVATPTPSAITYASNVDEVYVYNDAVFTLTRITSSTDVVAGFIAGFAGGSLDATFSGLTNHVFLLSGVGAPFNTMDVVDTSTNTISTTVSFGVGVGTEAQMIYAPDKNFLYSTTNTAGLTYVQEFLSPTQFFIGGGSTDYNEFVQDTFYNPKRIFRTMVYAENNDQLTNPVEVSVKDASGEQYQYPRLPNVHFSTGQFQNGIAQINFKDESCPFILDVNTTVLNYTLNPFEEVKFVLFYSEIDRVDLLTGRSNDVYQDGMYAYDANKFLKQDLDDTDYQKPMTPDEYNTTWSISQETASDVKESIHPI
jgi:hypothetical protein